MEEPITKYPRRKEEHIVMNLTEQKRRNDAFHEMEQRFKDKYFVKQFGNNMCFLAPNGLIFRLIEFPGEAALVIEYAETPNEAERSLFEDGDRFYLSDLSGDALFRAMTAEIESNLS